MNVNDVELLFSSSLLFFLRNFILFLVNIFLEQLNMFSVAALFCLVLVFLSCISLDHSSSCTLTTVFVAKLSQGHIPVLHQTGPSFADSWIPGLSITRMLHLSKKGKNIFTSMSWEQAFHSSWHIICSFLDSLPLQQRKCFIQNTSATLLSSEVIYKYGRSNFLYWYLINIYFV